MNMTHVMNDEISSLLKEVESAKQRLRDALRRAAPEAVPDLAFQAEDGRTLRLSGLFEGRHELILWHKMGRACAYCTLWADGIRGYQEHLLSRAAFVLTSADEPAVLREFASSRGWTMPRVSAPVETLKALRMADPVKGSPWPGISALRRETDGRILRTGYSYFGPGDDFCPVWPALDLLQDGPAGWEPRYSYTPHVTSVGIERSHD